MNTGRKTLDWLFREQLIIDAEWSEETPNGFRWWADKNEQVIEVTYQENKGGEQSGCYVSVRTELLRSLDLNDANLLALNSLVSLTASMSGPVYDQADGTLRLCSLVRVDDRISDWMNPLIGLASVLQIGEARIMGPVLAKILNADEARSGHPQRGLRPQPDDMANVIDTFIVPGGKAPVPWIGSEFREVVDQCVNEPIALLATASQSGYTINFPYMANKSSLCKVSAVDPHPRYGNGLLMVQSFPLSGMSDVEGARLAIDMNRIELAGNPVGYGFGSYVFRDKKLCFVCFIPNVFYRPKMLLNIYMSCAVRAQAAAKRFGGQ